MKKETHNPASHCTICGNQYELRPFKGKRICETCLGYIKKNNS